MILSVLLVGTDFPEMFRRDNDTLNYLVSSPLYFHSVQIKYTLTVTAFEVQQNQKIEEIILINYIINESFHTLLPKRRATFAPTNESSTKPRMLLNSH